MARKSEAQERIRFEKYFKNQSENVESSLIPSTDNTLDLGSAGNRWANVYTGDLHLQNERGNWTILEEADYLCVINNNTGQKFKMVLEPITQIKEK